MSEAVDDKHNNHDYQQIEAGQVRPEEQWYHQTQTAFQAARGRSLEANIARNYAAASPELRADSSEQGVLAVINDHFPAASADCLKNALRLIKTFTPSLDDSVIQQAFHRAVIDEKYAEDDFQEAFAQLPPERRNELTPPTFELNDPEVPEASIEIDLKKLVDAQEGQAYLNSIANNASMADSAITQVVYDCWLASQYLDQLTDNIYELPDRNSWAEATMDQMVQDRIARLCSSIKAFQETCKDRGDGVTIQALDGLMFELRLRGEAFRIYVDVELESNHSGPLPGWVDESNWRSPIRSYHNVIPLQE